VEILLGGGDNTSTFLGYLYCLCLDFVLNFISVRWRWWRYRRYSSYDGYPYPRRGPRGFRQKNLQNLDTGKKARSVGFESTTSAMPY
jgi:hypothetical protein